MQSFFREVHFFRGKFVFREVCFVERCFCREATDVHFQRAMHMQQSNENAEITSKKLISFFSTWLAIKDMALSGNKLIAAA